MLTGPAGTNIAFGTLSLTAYNRGSQNQQWRIQRLITTGNYYIINRANPQLMIRTRANQAVDLSNNSAAAEWRLERYGTRSYYQGRYAGPLHNGVARVGIGVTDSALVRGAGDMSLFWRGHDWNGISNNANVEVFRTTMFIDNANPNWSGRNDTFSVIVRGVDPDHNPEIRRIVGLVSPNGNGIRDQLSFELNTHWIWGTIYLSTGPEGMGSSDFLDRQALFVHEVGHVLKLAHPNEGNANLPSQLPRHSDWRPVSIMNRGLPSSSNPNSFGGITGYDRFNLRSAWR